VPEQKSFWKKYDAAIVALLTVLFIYILVFFNQKINFLLGNDLIVDLEPTQKSLSMHYGKSGKAEFDVTIDNVAYCRASCSYSFTDRSRNEIIEKGVFGIQKGQNFLKSYNLSVKRLGSGQDVYSFDVSCKSVRSFICLTGSPEKYRSSLVTINYDLTEAEKELKKILKQNMTDVLEVLKQIDVARQHVDQKYFELGFKANFLNISKQKIEVDDIYDKTRISIENLRSLWSVEDYAKLSRLFNESYFENLKRIDDAIGILDSSIKNIVQIHNMLLAELNLTSQAIDNLNVYSGVIGKNYFSGLHDLMKNFNLTASALTSNKFENYGWAQRNVTQLLNGSGSLIESSRVHAASAFFAIGHASRVSGGILCSIMQNCNGNFNLSFPIKGLEIFYSEYPDTKLLKESCNSLARISQEIVDARESSAKLFELNKTGTVVDGDFIKSAQHFSENELRKINNSYLDSFGSIVSQGSFHKDVIDAANSTLPKNKNDILPASYNQSLNISLYILSKMNLSGEASSYLSKCDNIAAPVEKTFNFSFAPIRSNITYNITSKVDANLSDNPPICCVFNDCKPCCRSEACKYDEKTFPVILLHGHSFASANSPEFSLDSFNKIQSKLQDDGYLNVGTVSLYSKNEQFPSGIWGLSGKPVTVKASYYYDAFRQNDKYIVIPTKSENLDTYAIRLKALIDLVKERTDKPKVKIVAHSMGGLIARRYIQIFGEDDVDKLIMIATPNKGITGQAGSYCGIIGENRECIDMQENSLFINKVNDPSKQPSKVKLYTLIGRGCQMDEKDGDGIVAIENAELSNAKIYFVNGTCGGVFGSKLHTELLDTDTYPETYKAVAEILKE